MQKRHFGAEEVLTSDRQDFTAGVFFCIFQKREVRENTYFPSFQEKHVLIFLEVTFEDR